MPWGCHCRNLVMYSNSREGSPEREIFHYVEDLKQYPVDCGSHMQLAKILTLPVPIRAASLLSGQLLMLPILSPPERGGGTLLSMKCISFRVCLLLDILDLAGWVVVSNLYRIAYSSKKKAMQNLSAVCYAKKQIIYSLISYFLQSR